MSNVFYQNCGDCPVDKDGGYEERDSLVSPLAQRRCDRSGRLQSTANHDMMSEA